MNRVLGLWHPTPALRGLSYSTGRGPSHTRITGARFRDLGKAAQSHPTQLRRTEQPAPDAKCLGLWLRLGRGALGIIVGVRPNCDSRCNLRQPDSASDVVTHPSPDPNPNPSPDHIQINNPCRNRTCYPNTSPSPNPNSNPNSTLSLTLTLTLILTLSLTLTPPYP